MIKYFQVTVRMVMVSALSFSASIANCRANSQYCLVAWKWIKRELERHGPEEKDISAHASRVYHDWLCVCGLTHLRQMSLKDDLIRSTFPLNCTIKTFFFTKTHWIDSTYCKVLLGNNHAQKLHFWNHQVLMKRINNRIPGSSFLCFTLNVQNILK